MLTVAFREALLALLSAGRRELGSISTPLSFAGLSIHIWRNECVSIGTVRLWEWRRHRHSVRGQYL